MNAKKKMTIFHPALLPYRVDFFNKLNEFFDASFYFSWDNVRIHKFNQDILRNEIHFKFNLLNSGFTYKKRTIRFGIFKIIRKNKPEIILCSEYGFITLTVVLYKLFINRKIRIYTISDDSINYSLERKGLRKWVRSLLSHIMDGIIFPSDLVGNWYLKEVNSKTKTLELPIIHSNDVFRKKIENSLIQSANNIETSDLAGKKIFLFVGRLIKLKNIDLLIKAFAKAECNNKMLLIVGDGEEKHELQKLTEELQLGTTCKFLGRLEDKELFPWFSIAQCFILPSLREAYGAVVNEALLAGCKVLCSNYAGASVLINKENGFTFNPKDEEELTHLIDKISLNIKPFKLPITLRSDLMPFTLNKKLEILFPQL